MASQLTGTGLDRLVKIIETDSGIARRVSDSDIARGAKAADGLNHMIVDGIRETGLANDGTIDASDLRALGDWARADATRYQTFVDLYGTNRNGVETGFQLVEKEDSSARLFGEDAVDEVAAAIYSFGFGDRDGRLLDVNGDLYRSVILTAGWLDELLTDTDMRALNNPNGSLVVEGTTGTGLDEIIDIIQIDPGLIRNVSRTDMATAGRAADALNDMYLDGISELGLANDGKIDKADVLALDEWVRSDPSRNSTYSELSEDWRLIENKGASLATYDGADDGVHPHVGHIVNHGLKGIYQIGNGSKVGVLFDKNGNPDVGARVPGEWLDQLLTSSQKEALNNRQTETPDNGQTETPDNPKGTTVVEANTGSGLDQIIDFIESDAGLIRNISRTDIAEATRAADGMNQILVEVIETLGVANDGSINGADVFEINNYIQGDGALYNEFLELRGAHRGDQSGFHLATNAGGSEKLFGSWAVNNVFDGIYSAANDIENKRFLDDDNDLSYGVSKVAYWIDEFYFA